ncbi:phytanoyl-CoA dioxygenase family protein [Zavarzinia sp.]|uniref:phytanoyl-CoA dioxygenase family protein n=1 Tax=Zavarzinia sp. TaxID=2027920 RepID=UPI003567DDCA
MNARQILMLPVHVLALATGAKSFVGNPVIGSTLLNRLGLHVARMVLADRIMAFRRLLLSALVAPEDRQALRRDGFILKPDFLAPEDLAAIEAEVRAMNEPARECYQGDTVTWRVLLDEDTLSRLPATRKLIEDRRYRHLLCYVAGRLRVPSHWVQRIRSGVRAGKRDPQTNLHADTFQPNMKAWLFLDDVSEDNGPFTFVPGSHRMTWRRVKYAYRRSIAEAGATDSYSARGSFRFEEKDLAELGLPAPRAFAVTRGTLVVADTVGLHRRGDSRLRPSSRLEIWSMCRTNPFNPLPGLPFRFLDRIDLALYRAFMSYQDRKAAKRGTKPSWRPVPRR